ncbi:hypothetical protein QFZ88_003718 [Mesorhizobium sp. YL-MeA3-2017]|jgi:hypothetical protein|nr:hypothetical protein [Mesorhizobium sp. YL-MeA3-2017]
MFEDVTGKCLELTVKSVVNSPSATHARYALSR